MTGSAAAAGSSRATSAAAAAPALRRRPAARDPCLQVRRPARAGDTTARLIADAAADLLRDADAVVPVPLTWRRAMSRGFNQADDLAVHLGLPVWRVLRRRRGGPPQTGLAAADRHANVRGAYARSAGARLRSRRARAVWRPVAAPRLPGASRRPRGRRDDDGRDDRRVRAGAGRGRRAGGARPDCRAIRSTRGGERLYRPRTRGRTTRCTASVTASRETSPSMTIHP